MKCPYCVSAIDPAAYVCATCRRDLYIVKPLLEKIEALEARLANLPAQLDDSAEQARALEERFASAEALDDDVHRSYGKALAWWGLTWLSLVAGQGLMFFVYDAPVVALHIYALILPLGMGYLFARAMRRPFVWGLLPAALLATLSVLSMSALTAYVDGVSVLPQTRGEWQEWIEFAASIGFSFITGLWLCHWQMRHDEHKRLAVLRQGLRSLAAVDSQKVAEKLGRLNDFGGAIVALLSTGFALYTGLKRFIG